MVKAGIINVASNSSHDTLGGRGPIFGDGSFLFVPIPEGYPTEASWSYGDLGLLDFLPDWMDEKGNPIADLCAHYDPEFETFTFGDYPKSAVGGRLNRKLQSLKKGDYLFFFASLDYEENGSKREPRIYDEGFYIIGYFKVETILKNIDHSMYTDGFLETYGNNAHVRRGEKDNGFWIIKGDEKRSALLKIAVPFDRALATGFIKTTSDGSSLTWSGQTEFSKISSYTRSPRLVSNKDQIDFLWKAIDDKNPDQSKIAGYIFG